MCGFVQTVEELTDKCRTHSTELAKTVSQYSHTQEEVRQIRYVCVLCVLGILSLCSNMLPLICYNRTVVSELKEEVRRLILQEHEPTSGKSIFSGFYAHTQTQHD